jgi:hypothetical protein
MSCPNRSRVVAAPWIVCALLALVALPSLLSADTRAPDTRSADTLVPDRAWPADDQVLRLDVASGDGRGVATAGPLVAGHVLAEVSLDVEAGGGLVLMHDRDGRPDPRHFVAIEVSRDGDGRTVVRGFDARDGRRDVLDPTGQVDRARYRHVLDGRYSLPFERTDLRVRIARDGATGFFRLSYAVRREIRGEAASGWISLAPVPGWGEAGQRFHVGVLAPTQAATTYRDLLVREMPAGDRDDTGRGFALERRDYHWSGFAGDAVVVTFDPSLPRHVAADGRAADTKFVFWSRANFVPAWHLSNQLLFTYEFVETWGGGGPGCYEPMSDRLLRWSRVEVMHDNAVRKVVRWRYVLADPDYRVPDDALGSEVPEAEELWTLYPDGTAVRLITYFPKLDSDFRNWNEVLELIAISGTTSDPPEHLASPAMTLADLGTNVLQFHPEVAFDKDAVNRWDEFIAVAHFAAAPDAFCAFLNTAPLPESLRPYPVRFNLDWHRTDYRFAHWPVETEPYQETHKTHGTFTEQVEHTSLIGAGIWEGTDWTDRFQTDRRGRRYRQWVSLVGLQRPGDLEGIRTRVRAWRDPRPLTVLAGADPAVRFEHASADYLLRPMADRVRLQVGPGDEPGRPLKTLRLVGWAGRSPRVSLGGTPVEPARLRVADEADALLVHLDGPVPAGTELAIDASPVGRAN